MTENLPAPAPEPSGEFLLYETDDGRIRIDVRLEGGTVWLTQAAMARLFQTTTQNITLHIKSIYDEGELREAATCKQYLQVRQEGKRQVHFAELQARARRPMHMADWIAKLDDFLRLSDRDILTHAGTISHDEAVPKAEAEFERYRQIQAALPQPVDQHFEQTLEELKRIEQQATKRRKQGSKRKPTKKQPKRPRSEGPA